MLGNWLGTSWAELALIATSTIAVYLAVIVYTRISGLRTFADLSAFDFAATVATGSLIATTAASPSVSLLNGLFAIAVLFSAQAGIALARRNNLARGALDNSPILLMSEGRIVEAGLRRGRLSQADLYAKLRMAGVARLHEVRAVILETTGDVSVVTGDEPLDEVLLDGVRERDHLPR